LYINVIYFNIHTRYKECVYSAGSQNQLLVYSYIQSSIKQRICLHEHILQNGIRTFQRMLVNSNSYRFKAQRAYE